MTQNDEAERPAYLIRKNGFWYRPNCCGYTTSAIQAGRYTLAEAEKFTHPNGPDGPRDGMHYIHEDEVKCDDLKAYRAQSARIAELEALVAAEFDMLDSTWKARAEAAEAEVARLREAVSLTARADNLREEYHKLPNDKNRIGDKRSKKSHARDAWLRAFRKAARVSRAALQPKEGE